MESPPPLPPTPPVVSPPPVADTEGDPAVPPAPEQSFDPEDPASLVPLAVRYATDRPAPRRRGPGVSLLVAAVVVAPTVAVVARAVLRMRPSPAQGLAPAAGGAGASPPAIAPDPLASAGVGATARPDELFARATADLRAARSGPAEPTRHWAAAGALHLGAVKSPTDLDRRVELLEALGTATRDARLAGDAVVQRLHGELAAGGGGAVERELWVAQWAAEVNFEDDRQVALAVEKFLAAGRTQLRMLRQEWGRWRLDRSTNRARFDDPGLQGRFDRQAAHVAAAELDLNEAVRRAGAGTKFPAATTEPAQ